MIGILIQLAVSWLIVWLTDKQNLSVLGFRPTKERISSFVLFLVITSVICASGFIMKMYFGDQRWKLNPELSFSFVLNGLWWNLKSVLFEELIFRGVLLYILIKRIGATKAIIISAVAFGIYHWFSFGVIGNPMGMIIAFITTGLMGIVLAYGYARTFSLYIPIAIHLGWNVTQMFIFSSGPTGNGILIPTTPGGFATDSYLIFILVTFLPMALALVINFLLIKQHKSRNPFTNIQLVNVRE